MLFILNLTFPHGYKLPSLLLSVNWAFGDKRIEPKQFYNCFANSFKSTDLQICSLDLCHIKPSMLPSGLIQGLGLYNKMWFLAFLKGFYLFIFRERGSEGEREGEKYGWLALTHLTRESNQRPFAWRDNPQLTHPDHNGQGEMGFLSGVLISCSCAFKPMEQS